MILKIIPRIADDKNIVDKLLLYELALGGLCVAQMRNYFCGIF